MPVKEKLSGISLLSLLPENSVKPRILIKDESLLSSPFIIPKNRNLHSQFTGRVKELDYLRTLYAEVLRRVKKQNAGTLLTHKPIIAAVKGEPGIGKSRLVREFTQRVTYAAGNDLNNIFFGQNLNTGQNPYGMFSNIIPGLDSGKKEFGGDQKYITVNNSAKEFLFKKAAMLNNKNLPLVVVFEDMQWADESSLNLLEHIIRSVNICDQQQPQFFIILNYRNYFKPSKILKTECEYHELSLEGFNEPETLNLIESLAGNKLNGKTKEIINLRSDGNPFYIEEWCTLICGNKKISQIPKTIRHLLVDKVAELNPEERSILIIASVLGRKFELKIVNEILKRAAKPLAAKHVMRSLEEKRYIVNLTGDIYEFRHDILQETIYRELRKDVKQNVHSLAGEVIETLCPIRLSDYYYELARHYTAAKNETKSIEYLEKAGDKAKDNFENERALKYYYHLLKRISGNKTLDITFKICDVHMNRSEWNMQIELCNGILNISPRLDKNIKAECYKRIGHAFRLKGEYKNALICFKKGYTIYNDKGNSKEKLIIMENEAKVKMAMGNYSESIKSFELIYKISKKYNFYESYKNSLIGLCIVNSKISRYEDNIKFTNELFGFCRDNNDRTGMITANINKAEALFYTGKYDEACDIYKKALKEVLEINLLNEAPVCLGNLGIIYFTRKNYKKALICFTKQLQLFIKLGDKAGIARANGLLGSCFINTGDFNKAGYYLIKQLVITKELKRKQSEAVCLGNLGIIFFQQGKFNDAAEYLENQLKIDRAINNREGMYRAYVNLSVLYKYLSLFEKAFTFVNKALHIALKYKFKNSSVAILNKAEILFYYKRYKEIVCLIDKFCAAELEKENSPEIEIFLLYQKALLFAGFNNQNSHVRDKLIKEYFKRLNQRLIKSRDYNEKALIYYDLWKISLLLKEHNRLYDNVFFKDKALYCLNKIYSASPRIEYRIKIDELKSN